MANSLLPPFRADVVGSYLRPGYLKQARQQFADGEISKNDLRSVEDKAITELVAQQRQAGLKVITDGEFRRSWWHLDFMWGLQGVERVELDKGYQFASIETRAESARLNGKIRGENHPFIDHFQFIQKLTSDDVVARLTVPAPAQFFKELNRPDNIAATREFYPDDESLMADIASAYQIFIKELYTAGCRSLQLDDCTWGMLTDEKFARQLGNAATAEDGCDCHGGSFDHAGSIRDLKQKLLTVNNESLSNAPDDLVLTTHVCRGNYRSAWSASGGYEPVADVLLGHENVDAFYLEFDTDRAGDFSPLRHLAKNKKVVLGLVSSKTADLEDASAIADRIRQAAEFVPLQNLYLSTQCGFASTEEGNELTEAQQWQKIALVQTVAKRVWGV